MVPDMALASRDSSTGTKVSVPPLFSTLTSAFCVSARAPRAPLTLIWLSLTDTSTPAGTVTGSFPIRDINFSSMPASVDVTQDFATDTGRARLAVGHHTLRGGDDGHAQAILDLRNGFAATVNAQAGTAHALD